MDQQTTKSGSLKKGIGHLAFLLIGAVTLLASCDDEGSNIGGNILPQEEIVGVYTYNSMPISSQNKKMDKIQSDDVAYALIGHMNDSEFGNLKSDFFGELTIGGSVPNGQFNRYDGFMVDSAMIFLNFKKDWVIGDTLAKHKVNIYQLEQPLSTYENYFSDFDISGYYNPAEPIAQGVLNAKNIFLSDTTSRADSIWNIKDRELQWAFKLNDETAKKIFEMPKESLSSREAFKEAFNGIYITSELEDPSSKGSLMRFGLMDKKSYMKLYYSYERKDKYGNIVDTLKYDFSFYFNYESVRANRFTNDSEEIDVDNNDTQHLYIQSLAGSMATFKLSNDIYNWKDSVNNENFKMGISTIDLIFHIDTALSKVKEYTLPTTLQVKQIDSKTGNLVVPKFLTTSGTYEQAFIGGVINYTNLTYHFRFARGFLESVLTNDDKIFENEFYLVPTDMKSNYQRVVLNGSTATINDEKRLKLDIKYVKFH